MLDKRSVSIAVYSVIVVLSLIILILVAISPAEFLAGRVVYRGF